ncbi:uncharacterized protein LOC135401328 isoform X2 [Ornithodoros turicata]|uniref:uncharacterized protein LOC135401328 isoform X2 n=1 Tax=Ornithodoros turicata TaxID=34597 RepID=UPI003139EC2F
MGDSGQQKDLVGAEYGFTNYSMSRMADVSSSDENAGGKSSVVRVVVVVVIGICLLAAAIFGIFMLLKNAKQAPVTGGPSSTDVSFSTKSTQDRNDPAPTPADPNPGGNSTNVTTTDALPPIGFQREAEDNTSAMKYALQLDDAKPSTNSRMSFGLYQVNAGAASLGKNDDWKKIYSELMDATYAADGDTDAVTSPPTSYNDSPRTSVHSVRSTPRRRAEPAIELQIFDPSSLISLNETDDTSNIEAPVNVKNRTLHFALPNTDKCTVCAGEVARLKQLISSTKAPCNDFYEFVCARFSRTLKLVGNVKFVTSPISQDIIIAKSVEDKLLRVLADYLSGNKEAGWAHKVAWDSCVLDKQSPTTSKSVLRRLVEDLGLVGWPYNSREHFTEGTVARITAALARQLGLNVLFGVGLVSLVADDHSRHYFSIEEPDLLLRSCNTISPTREVTWYSELVKAAILILTSNITGIIDIQEAIFSISCSLAKAASRKEERTYIFQQTTIQPLMSMNTLVMPIKAFLQDITTLSMDASIAIKHPAFIEVLQSLLQPENYASLMNYLGFRALVYLSAMSSLGRDEFTHATMESMTGWRQKSWERPTVCLRLVEKLLPELLLFSYYKHYFNSTDVGMKHLFVDAMTDSVVQLAARSPWGSSSSYVMMINHTLSVLKVKRFLPSWLQRFKERWFFNRHALKGLTSGSFIKLHANIQSNMWQLYLNKSMRSRLEKWDASVFDTMLSFNAHENVLYIPMSIFDIEDTYSIPLHDDSSIMYAAFLFWKFHYALAPLFTAIALNERSKSSKHINAHTSFTAYKECVIKQYKQKVDKVTRLRLNADSTFLTDNRDMFSTIRSPPPVPEPPDGGRTLFQQFTASQLYYIYYTLGKCEIHAEEHIDEVIEKGDFSPPRYRVNIPLRNSKDFRDTWGCKPPLCRLNAEDQF